MEPSREDSQQSLESHESQEDLSYMSDGGYDDDDDDVPVAALPVHTEMSVDKLAAEQAEQIGQVAALLEVPLVSASVLLRTFQWNTEKLIEQFYEDSDRVLEKAGLSSPGTKRQKSTEGDAGCSEEVTCGVCFCDEPRAKTSANERCGHRFCNDCWTGHLKVQITEGNAQAVVCMQDGCRALVELPMVQALVDPKLFATFARFAQKQFVDDNPYLKFCPAAGCEHVIKVRDLGRPEIACSCGFVWCFGCSREAHFPLRCEQLDAWEDKNTSDAGTGQWMQAHTKRCRKCHARVEKNGGCNWISCRCGHQFCYFCFGTEQSHHNVVCNAPPTAEAAGAKSDLEYYMHYFDRWHGHCESQKLEGPLRQSARDQMDSLMHCTEAPRALSEVQHLGEAAEALIDCRRVLKHTYPRAFQMVRGPEKELFEDLQARLEAQTERLSAALEAPKAESSTPLERDASFGEHRVELVRLASDARLRLRHLREGIEDGLLAPAAGPAHQAALAAAGSTHAPPHSAAAAGSANDPIVV